MLLSVHCPSKNFRFTGLGQPYALFKPSLVSVDKTKSEPDSGHTRGETGLFGRGE
jgi:hypothetical protein